MRRAIPSIHRRRTRYQSCASRPQRRLLGSITHLASPLDRLNADEFRRQAFIPELPLLITTNDDLTSNAPTASRIPAIRKWFNILPNGRQVLNFSYLEQFRDVALP